jgi:Fur family transcriptional regulator, ferric uptake regulator
MASTAQKLAKERFTEFLREGSYRITPERFEILSAVLRTDEHFDAESLFLGLRSAGSKVSRATVYKTLTLLHECGLVSRYTFSPGELAQYEKTVDRPRHDHMVCTRCGGITEFPNGAVLHLQRQLCRLHGFEPTYHSFQIYGICGDCRRKQRTGATADLPATVDAGELTDVF